MTEIKKLLGYRLSSPTRGMFVLSGIASVVELKGKQGFLFLGNKERGQPGQNLNGFVNSNVCNEKEPMFRRVFPMACPIVGHFGFEKVTIGLNRTGIGHFNRQVKGIGMAFPCTSRSSPLDGYAAFPINQSGEIRFIHACMQDTIKAYQSQELLLAKLPNSVDTLPGYAEGNTEPSSAQCAGVCRDYGVAPTRDDIVRPPSKYGECGRNVHTLLRQSNNVENQDASTAKIIWQGNMTTNNRRMHGRVISVTA